MNLVLARPVVDAIGPPWAGLVASLQDDVLVPWRMKIQEAVNDITERMELVFGPGTGYAQVGNRCFNVQASCHLAIVTLDASASARAV